MYIVNKIQYLITENKENIFANKPISVQITSEFLSDVDFIMISNIIWSLLVVHLVPTWPKVYFVFLSVLKINN